MPLPRALPPRRCRPSPVTRLERIPPPLAHQRKHEQAVGCFLKAISTWMSSSVQPYDLGRKEGKEEVDTGESFCFSSSGWVSSWTDPGPGSGPGHLGAPSRGLSGPPVLSRGWAYDQVRGGGWMRRGAVASGSASLRQSAEPAAGSLSLPLWRESRRGGPGHLVNLGFYRKNFWPQKTSEVQGCQHEARDGRRWGAAGRPSRRGRRGRRRRRASRTGSCRSPTSPAS